MLASPTSLLAKLFSRLLSLAVGAVVDAPASQDGARQTLSLLLRFPTKAIAVFLMAPFLAYRVAVTASDPWRRRIAFAGLVLAVGGAYAAGTALGTVAAAMLAASTFGLLAGVAVLLGAGLSVVFSAVLSLVALNAVSVVALKISSEEVVAHLRSISQ